MQESQQTITTEDGFEIATTTYQPAIEINGVVVIAAAMSVPQKFYRDFAVWLSRQNMLVVTFDYRGIGQSAPSSLKNFKASISDWAQYDCAAVLHMAGQRSGAKPIYWIGHSLGGQIIGLIPNCHLICKAITVASGNGYWRTTVKFQKLASLWMWYVAVPLVSLFCSYFPGKKLRKVGDLPMGAIKQWRRWCLSKHYLMDNVDDLARQRYHDVKFPMTFYALADDEMLSVKAIKSVHSFYANAPRKFLLLRPEENNVKRIGHFGFFRQNVGEQLWDKYVGRQLIA